MTTLSADQVLERYFLDARSKLLDVAAILDRLGRGQGASTLDADPRLLRIRQALEVLHDQSGGRAERIQRLFSLDYDAAWQRPQPH
jgi:hypothetical protein